MKISPIQNGTYAGSVVKWTPMLQAKLGSAPGLTHDTGKILGGTNVILFMKQKYSMGEGVLIINDSKLE